MSTESLATRLRWSLWLAANAPPQPRFPFRPPEAIATAQARRLAATAEHAYGNVPAHREAMRRLSLHPGDLRTAADLARLPLLEREDVQRDPERFASRAQPVSSYVEFRTSGVSGRPLTIWHDQFALFQNAAHRQRRNAVLMRLAGRRFRFRHVSIRPEGGAGDKAGRAFARRTLLPTAVRSAQLRLSQQNPMARNVELLNEFRPDVISSFGSYIDELFLYLHRERPPFRPPRVVNFSSEALSDEVRRLITDEFGIPVIGFYGSVEAFTLGWECEAHRGYHLNDDLYPVRVVDPEGRELPDGEPGEVVVSNLVSRGTTLLNYRLGDRAARLPGSCPCGRNLPLLSYLEGRIGDWIETASGERVHPIAVEQLLNEEAPSIWRFQIVQRSTADFEVSVVAKEGADREGLRARLARRFAERLGERTRLKVHFVDELPRWSTGKIPPVISRAGSARYD